MNINGYVPFLILSYTLRMNINWYVPITNTVIYPTYQQKWVCPIPHKYIGYYCEWGKISLVVTYSSGYILHAVSV